MAFEDATKEDWRRLDREWTENGGFAVDERAAEIAGRLSEAQRRALIEAREGESGFWFVSLRHPGFRGLPAKELALGRATASRHPGTLGRLTTDGMAVRSCLLQEVYRGEGACFCEQMRREGYREACPYCISTKDWSRAPTPVEVAAVRRILTESDHLPTPDQERE